MIATACAAGLLLLLLLLAQPGLAQAPGDGHGEFHAARTAADATDRRHTPWPLSRGH